MKIFFDIHHSSVIVPYMQIPKAKYKQGIKLFQEHKDKNNGIVNVVSLKSDLRRLGYSNKEIDSFFASTSDLRFLLSCYKDELERRFADELGQDPLAPYADNYEIQFDIQ